jgi:hypothetical protein
MVFIYNDFWIFMKIFEKNKGVIIKNDNEKDVINKITKIRKQRKHVFKVCLTNRKGLNTLKGNTLIR